MAAMNILFGLYSSNNYTLCWITAKIGTKIEIKLIILVIFRKWNSFTNSRKDGKFGINLVDSMLNALCTLELANISQFFNSTWKHYHTQWSSNIMQWFMDEGIMWNMLFKAHVVLSKDSTQSVPNVTNLQHILNEFHFLKGASIIYLNLSSFYHSRV